MKTNTILFKLLVVFAIGLLSRGTFATTFSVDVRDFEFSPSTILTVRIGDTIHWEWKNGFHTTTSTSIPAGAATWDAPITSSTMTFNYVPTVLGTYNYKCTPHESMGMVGSFTVTAAAGIANNLPTVKINIYPNPFTEKVTISADANGNTQLESLRVYDVTGNMLRQVKFPGNGNPIERDLLFAELPSGLLLFEFRDSQGAIFIRRVVKE